jgi:membrane-bound ClpP family serine protease
MVDQEVRVAAYSRVGTGQTRYFCAEELDEYQQADQEWELVTDIDTVNGLTGAEAVGLHLARFTVSDLRELQQVYHLDGIPERIQPTWAHRVVEFLASPAVAGGLLFIGWFALMIEFASPGLSVAGFVSAVCFLLFFWANYLHGTAGWLEILLFVAGVTCVIIEIFVIPGVGAFGIGGGLMIVASIVLASQTFVVPRNSYELNQLPVSLYMVAAAGCGAVLSMIVMSRVLTHAPLFRRIALDLPDQQRQQEIEYQESLAHREYLMGKRGVTTTQLRPAGKARFGDDIVDVLSDGDVIPSGTPIYVVRVKGNEVQVRTI